jgi:hypothetical protein
MSAVERITERLRGHPELVYRVSGGTITVEPSRADGFPVSLTEGAGEWVVAFDGWHERFASEDEALDCFAFGLSDRCRLKVHYRGRSPYRWTVEARAGDGWREDSTTGRLFFPFWRRPRVAYRRNAVTGTAEPGAAAVRFSGRPGD